MTTNMISTHGLRKTFGRLDAVQGLDLAVKEGSATALVGANGAGKSTAIRLIMNLLQPDSGSAEVLGIDSRKLTPRELEQVATAAEQILASISPLEKELDKATGAKKGAITKHIHRIVDGLLIGEELNEEDAELTAGVDQKNLEKARGLGNGSRHLVGAARHELLDGETARPRQQQAGLEAGVVDAGRGQGNGRVAQERVVGAQAASSASRDASSSAISASMIPSSPRPSITSARL